MRLLLALAVLASHAGVRLHGLNPGVTAVVGFYLISGYVMTGLIRRHFAAPRRIPAFYLDRLARILPQYLAYAAATLVWFLLTDRQTLFLARQPTAVDLLNNLTIVPLNFYMWNGADAFTLIPPGWSLGAELQFYLLAPLLVLWPLLLASLAVYGAALAGALNADWFGYRLLAGLLWIFAVGSALFVLQRARPRAALALALAAPPLALAVYLLLRHFGLHAVPYHQEVLLGWGLGPLLLHGLSRRRGGRLDALAGDLSYGVFLNHFLLIWLFEFDHTALTGARLALLMGASVLLSYGTQRLIERPVLAWRRRLRLS
jgi:peptidoglycan/LPS O-acetylase OafA/YrhL